VSAHGTTTTRYDAGCRCSACREAKRDYIARNRSRLRAERVDVDGHLTHPRASHGTRRGRWYYHCECALCGASAPAPTDVDEIAVAEFLHGRPVRLTVIEKRRVVLLALEQGWSARHLSDRTTMSYSAADQALCRARRRVAS